MSTEGTPDTINDKNRLLEEFRTLVSQEEAIIKLFFDADKGDIDAINKAPYVISEHIRGMDFSRYMNILEKIKSDNGYIFLLLALISAKKCTQSF